MTATPRNTYRHGDLRRALLDAGIELARAGGPDAVVLPVHKAGVAPANFHATTIFPEYFKIAGQWKLLTESRMENVPSCLFTLVSRYNLSVAIIPCSFCSVYFQR